MWGLQPMGDETPVAAARRIRVVLAEDDPFALSLVADGLTHHGLDVRTASTVGAAWELVASVEPHAVVTDLNFGHEESGASLLARVNAEFPWIGLVVLTSHISPTLAVDDPAQIPEGVVYLVKSRLHQISELVDAITTSISGASSSTPSDDVVADGIRVTPAQAEVLRMLAEGISTRALADHRQTTVRAVETMLARLYTSLGVLQDDASNPRVAAVLLWQQGKVSVR